MWGRCLRPGYRSHYWCHSTLKPSWLAKYICRRPVGDTYRLPDLLEPSWVKVRSLCGKCSPSVLLTPLVQRGFLPILQRTPIAPPNVRLWYSASMYISCWKKSLWLPWWLFCLALVPEYSAGRRNSRLKVLWLGCCPNLSTGDLAWL